MSALLDEQPALASLIQQDLDASCPCNPHTGRPGLTGEQTLRILVLRQLTGWTYAELAFHLADSATYRAFGRLGALTSPPSRSAVADTLRRVRRATLRRLNDQLVTGAAARAVEPAQTVRMDATVVPVAIHHPTDSSLLGDSVRVLDRLLRRLEAHVGFTAYHRHGRRVKRRALEIDHLAPPAAARRRQCYRELLELTTATATYATCGLAHLECLPRTRERDRLRAQLTRFLPLVAQVIDQTTRRVLAGRRVEALRCAAAASRAGRSSGAASRASVSHRGARLSRRGALSRARPG